jgi:UrcA family protein
MNTRTLNLSALMTVAIAAAMISLSAGATETTADGVLETVVSYRDLNLSCPEGVAALYQRVSHAAAQVCAPLESREVARMSTWKSCVNGALSRAIATINVPALSAYADARKVGSNPLMAARTE